MSVYASIDLGSNTVRILVVRKNCTGFETLYSNQKITRLGQGLSLTGNLLPEAIDRTVDVVMKFQKEATPYKPEAIWIVATSAVRTANNRDVFVNRIKAKTGLAIEVIPWEEEGRRALLGVCYGIKKEAGSYLVFDIGGGSAEIFFSRNSVASESVGTDLGVVRLSEKYLTKYPIDNGEFQKMEGEIQEKIEKARTNINLTKETILVGTAGTITTIAALDLDLYPYDPVKINGHKISRDKIDNLLVRFKKMTLSGIRALSPIEKGREDLIIAGLTITKTIMETFGFDETMVSDYGLREGILLDRI